MIGESIDLAGFTIGHTYSREAIARTGQVYVPTSSRDPHWSTGIVRFDNAVLLLVTLKKTDYSYQDSFADDLFWWQSQTQQTQQSPVLKEISSERLVPHLFARVEAKAKGKAEPFVYCGALSRPVMKGEKPVTVLFQVSSFVTDASGDLAKVYAWRQSGVTPSTEVRRRALAMNDAIAIGAIKRPSRQGRIKDSVTRRAIERHAMDKATAHYVSAGYVVTDTSAAYPFDLLCERDDDVRRVEVKGTRSLGSAVDVTVAEVEQARLFPTDLFINHSLVVRAESEPNAITVTGDEYRVVQNWVPANESLSPLTFRHLVSKQADV
jgi:hypothetical protein